MGFYVATEWCLLYSDACTSPLVENDGASSYRIMRFHSSSAPLKHAPGEPADCESPPLEMERAKTMRSSDLAPAVKPFLERTRALASDLPVSNASGDNKDYLMAVAD